jgi:hypothetical protein
MILPPSAWHADYFPDSMTIEVKIITPLTMIKYPNVYLGGINLKSFLFLSIVFILYSPMLSSEFIISN